VLTTYDISIKVISYIIDNASKNKTMFMKLYSAINKITANDIDPRSPSRRYSL